jgi:hypothetical protein
LAFATGQLIDTRIQLVLQMKARQRIKRARDLQV